MDWTDHHTAEDPEGHGSVFHVEGKILADTALALGGDVVEIGCRRGTSTRYIHAGLDRHGRGRVFAVDPNHEWGEAPDWPRRVVIHAQSPDYVLPDDADVRWGFVDGNHTYDAVCGDVRRLVGLGATTILLHDTRSIPELRRAAVDTLVGWTITDLDTPCGMVSAECPS